MTLPVDMSTTLGNAWFPSPIFTASGCASSGKELAQFFPLNSIGAVVTKSVMSKPRHGRPTPRMAETPSGMLNSIGLQGPGIDAFLANDVPWLLEQKARVVVSIAGETIEEYSTLARKLRSVSGLSAVEVNISCPNVENRGLVFACDPDASRRVIDGVRKTIGGELPIIAKLSPDVTNLPEIAKGVVDAGADALALINTVLGKDFHVISVQSCTDAISHLQSDCSKDVVILDIADVSSENMDLLEHFYTSAVFKNIKTVVISNSNDESLKDKTVQLGASLFLTKPFDPVNLTEMLKNMVNSTELIPVKKRKNNFNLNIF